MSFPARVDDFLQRIEHYGKESLADILHDIGEAVPLITRQSRFRLYLEDLTGGILSCVLATGRTRKTVRDYVFSLTDENYLVSRVSSHFPNSLVTKAVARSLRRMAENKRDQADEDDS